MHFCRRRRYTTSCHFRNSLLLLFRLSSLFLMRSLQHLSFLIGSPVRRLFTSSFQQHFFLLRLSFLFTFNSTLFNYFVYTVSCSRSPHTHTHKHPSVRVSFDDLMLQAFNDEAFACNLSLYCFLSQLNNSNYRSFSHRLLRCFAISLWILHTFALCAVINGLHWFPFIFP